MRRNYKKAGDQILQESLVLFSYTYNLYDPLIHDTTPGCKAAPPPRREAARWTADVTRPPRHSLAPTGPLNPVSRPPRTLRRYMAVPSSKSLKCSDQTRKNQLYPNDKHCAAMRNATASPPLPQNECCPRFRPPGFRFTGTTNQNSSSREEPKREKAAGHCPKCQQLDGPITRRKATESPTQPPRLNNAIASNYPPKTTAAQDSGPHGLLPTKASNQNRPP